MSESDGQADLLRRSPNAALARGTGEDSVLDESGYILDGRADRRVRLTQSLVSLALRCSARSLKSLPGIALVARHSKLEVSCIFHFFIKVLLNFLWRRRSAGCSARSLLVVLLAALLAAQLVHRWLRRWQQDRFCTRSLSRTRAVVQL